MIGLLTLRSKPFSFVIRIRIDARVRKPGKMNDQAAKKLFGCEQFKVLRKPRVVFGHRLYLAGQRISDREYLILISDKSLKTR